MKSSPDSLFQLIKSLSMSEKRYFTLFTSKYNSNGKSNYIKLFDAISDQEVYDEKQLKKDLRDRIMAKNLPVEKNYLSSLILQSLNVFHSHISIDSEIRNLIHQLEVLHGKGLNKHCRIILLKAKHLAIVNEKFALLLELIDWELKIASVHDNFDQLFQLQKTTLKQCHNLMAYQHISKEIANTILSKGIARTSKDRKIVDKLMKSPLLKSESQALSLRAKLVFYNVYELYYHMKGDFSRNYKVSGKMLEILEANSSLIKEKPMHYLGSMNNYIIACFHLKKFSEIFKCYEKFELVAERSIQVEVKKFLLLYIYRPAIHIVTGEFEKGFVLIKSIEEGLKKYEGKIRIADEVVLYKNVSWLYFGMKQYRKSLLWLNKILNHSSDEVRRDTYSLALIFNLIIHFELGNSDLLEYSVKSAYRFLYKKQNLFAFEKSILHFIRKAAQYRIGSGELTEEFRKLKKELVSVFEKAPTERRVLEFFDFLSWIDSKIEGKDFAQVIREKYKP